VGYAALAYTLEEAIKKGYDVTDLGGDLATRADLERIIAEKAPIFFHAFGHGNETTFTGQGTIPVITKGVNEEICRGMIIYLLSCLTGVSLGPAIIAAGGWAYTGYTVEWTWLDEDGVGDPYLDRYAKGFYESGNAIPMVILNGFTTGEAYQAGYDKYTEWIDYWATSDDPAASECIHWLTCDRDNCVLLGDSGAGVGLVRHRLTINSEPAGISFKVDIINGVTPWSEEIAEGVRTLTMPSRFHTETAIYAFDHWEDGSTNPTRTINLTADMTVAAYYVEVPAHILTVKTTPISDIEFTINNAIGLTPFSELLEEGEYTITMPSRVYVGETAYDFVRWEVTEWKAELQNPTRTINLTSDTTVTAVYEEVPIYLLSTDSNLPNVLFTIDSVKGYTTPTILRLLRGSYIISFPSEVEYNGQRLTFKVWENGTTSPTRTLNLTGSMKIIGYYTALTLTVNSTPISGVPVTIDGYSIGITPLSTPVSEGTHAVSVPMEVEA
jgi:hypothetical protein